MFKNDQAIQHAKDWLDKPGRCLMPRGRMGSKAERKHLRLNERRRR